MRIAAICCYLLALTTASLACGLEPQAFFAVPLPVSAPRLLGMSMDDDGFIWLGSTHRVIFRYDPRRGEVEELKLPFDSSTSQTICIGQKVYLLGQSYPKLMCYRRDAKTFSEFAYPAAKADVWYGTEAVDGRHLYLFDRGDAGVIKWDSTTDTGTAIPYPYPTPKPSSGRFVAEDGAIWCGVWDLTDAQYVPLGVARLDIAKNEFTGCYPFPAIDSDDPPFSNPETTVFYPYSLKGKIVPFDWQQRRWCKSIAVPGFGERFGFIGGGSAYDGRWFFSLSTYDGTATGCDGKPYHFCNGMLEFDPTTGSFAFPTLDAADAYYQISYHLSAGGQLFATGNNIREADGTLNMARVGEAVFWQTQAPEREPR